MRLLSKVKRIIEYIPILWEDEDWEWIFILDLLQYKLKRTRECLVEDSLNKDIGEREKQILYAESLIDKIREDEGPKKIGDAWVDLEQKYLNKLCDHLAKNIRNWWD